MFSLLCCYHELCSRMIPNRSKSTLLNFQAKFQGFRGCQERKLHIQAYAVNYCIFFESNQWQLMTYSIDYLLANNASRVRNAASTSFVSWVCCSFSPWLALQISNSMPCWNRRRRFAIYWKTIKCHIEHLLVIMIDTAKVFTSLLNRWR